MSPAEVWAQCREYEAYWLREAPFVTKDSCPGADRKFHMLPG